MRAGFKVSLALGASLFLSGCNFEGFVEDAKSFVTGFFTPSNLSLDEATAKYSVCVAQNDMQSDICQLAQKVVREHSQTQYDAFAEKTIFSELDDIPSLPCSDMNFPALGKSECDAKQEVLEQKMAATLEVVETIPYERLGRDPFLRQCVENESTTPTCKIYYDVFEKLKAERDQKNKELLDERVALVSQMALKDYFEFIKSEECGSELIEWTRRMSTLPREKTKLDSVQNMLISNLYPEPTDYVLEPEKLTCDAAKVVYNNHFVNMVNEARSKFETSMIRNANMDYEGLIEFGSKNNCGIDIDNPKMFQVFDIQYDTSLNCAVTSSLMNRKRLNYIESQRSRYMSIVQNLDDRNHVEIKRLYEKNKCPEVRQLFTDESYSRAEDIIKPSQNVVCMAIGTAAYNLLDAERRKVRTNEDYAKETESRCIKQFYTYIKGQSDKKALTGTLVQKEFFNTGADDVPHCQAVKELSRYRLSWMDVINYDCHYRNQERAIKQRCPTKKMID